MMRVLVCVALLAISLEPGATARAQSADGSTTNPTQLVARWTASNTTCRNPAASAVDAIGACEQRDTYSKLLASISYCYGPTNKAAGATWSPCDGNRLPDTARARATERFQRMGGVFVLPAIVNGTTKSYFVVDSGAASVQIPEEVIDEMKRNGTITDADFLGQRRVILADGSGLQLRVFRLRTLQIDGRTMDNVLAAVGAPRSHALLGQSFLRRLSWWKIDNVTNAIEFEFTGAF
jgi:hypothetical protein